MANPWCVLWLAVVLAFLHSTAALNEKIVDLKNLPVPPKFSSVDTEGWRYWWIGSQNALMHIRPCNHNGAMLKIAYLGNDGRVYVVGIAPDMSVISASTVSTQGTEVRGFWAHPNGDVALTVRRPYLPGKDNKIDPKDGLYFVKIKASKTVTVDRMIDDRIYGFNLAHSALEYAPETCKYVSYHKTHSISRWIGGGHEGDATSIFPLEGPMEFLDGDLTAGKNWHCGSSWGCSHSLDLRLAYNPTTRDFAQICACDAYPKGVKFMPLMASAALVGKTYDNWGNEGGKLGHNIGSMLPYESDFIYTFSAPNTWDVAVNNGETQGLSIWWASSKDHVPKIIKRAADATEAWVGATMAFIGADKLAFGFWKQKPAKYSATNPRTFYTGIIDAKGNWVEAATAKTNVTFDERNLWVTVCSKYAVTGWWDHNTIRLGFFSQSGFDFPTDCAAWIPWAEPVCPATCTPGCGKNAHCEVNLCGKSGVFKGIKTIEQFTADQSSVKKDSFQCVCNMGYMGNPLVECTKQTGTVANCDIYDGPRCVKCLGSAIMDFSTNKCGDDDCKTAANGPNKKTCMNGGVCVDPIKFDRNFTCDCSDTSGYFGNNCEEGSPHDIVVDNSVKPLTLVVRWVEDKIGGITGWTVLCHSPSDIWYQNYKIDVGPAERSAEIAKLDPTKLYDCSVVGHNPAGDSKPLVGPPTSPQPLPPVSPPGAPDAPIKLVGVQTEAATVDLIFDQPPVHGMPDTWTITIADTSKTSNTSLFKPVVLKTVPISDVAGPDSSGHYRVKIPTSEIAAKIPNPTAIAFQMKGTNTSAALTSAASMWSAPLILMTSSVPSKMDPPRVDNKAEPGKLQVTWKAPAQAGGSPITSYTLVATNVADPKDVITIKVDAPSLNKTLDNVKVGANYTVTVVATNTQGPSALSDPSAKALVLAVITAPPAPSVPIVDNASDKGKLKVSWTAPTTDGGSPITSYTVKLTNAADPTDVVTVVVDGGNLTKTVDGLKVGAKYTAAITATNAKGTSPSSPAAAATEVLSTASLQPPPTAATVDNSAEKGKLKVSWPKPVANAALPPITGYVVTLTNAADPTDVVKVPVTGADSLSKTVDGLKVGAKYTATVATSNANGPSSASPSSVPTEVLAAASVPGVPATPTVDNTEKGKLKVSWQPPASDGGAPINGYTVKLVNAADPSDVVSVPVDGTTLSKDVTGLKPNAKYLVSVAASNAQGTSPASAPSAASEFLPKDVPAGTTKPSAPGPAVVDNTSEKGALAVSWPKPTSDGGLPITGYTVKAVNEADPTDVVSVIVGPDELNKTLTGVKAGAKYAVTVAANNDAGPSDPSTPSTAVEVLAAPAPTSSPSGSPPSGSPSDTSNLPADTSGLPDGMWSYFTDPSVPQRNSPFNLVMDGRALTPGEDKYAVIPDDGVSTCDTVKDSDWKVVDPSYVTTMSSTGSQRVVVPAVTSPGLFQVCYDFVKNPDDSKSIVYAPLKVGGVSLDYTCPDCNMIQPIIVIPGPAQTLTFTGQNLQDGNKWRLVQGGQCYSQDNVLFIPGSVVMDGPNATAILPSNIPPGQYAVCYNQGAGFEVMRAVLTVVTPEQAASKSGSQSFSFVQKIVLAIIIAIIAGLCCAGCIWTAVQAYKRRNPEKYDSFNAGIFERPSLSNDFVPRDTY